MKTLTFRTRKRFEVETKAHESADAPTKTIYKGKGLKITAWNKRARDEMSKRGLTIHSETEKLYNA